MSDERYIGVVGFRQFYGRKIFKPEQVVKLVKEPNNAFDDEAIRVEMKPLGQVGYVANSTTTVPRGCHSAGRIYDTFDRYCYGIVRFVTKESVIVELMDKIRMQIVLVETSEVHQSN
ncbi:MAG TPA: DNA-binding protein [Firmicutes bacterium]|nr:DNA-binding protein [Bacillota bacterium]